MISQAFSHWGQSYRVCKFRIEHSCVSPNYVSLTIIESFASYTVYTVESNKKLHFVIATRQAYLQDTHSLYLHCINTTFFLRLPSEAFWPGCQPYLC